MQNPQSFSSIRPFLLVFGFLCFAFTPVSHGVTFNLAENTSATTVTIHFALEDNGAGDSTLFVYWGSTDGGQEPGAWSSAQPIQGAQSPGDKSIDLTDLTGGQQYHLRVAATTEVGTTWSDPFTFTAKAPPEVTLDNATIAENGGDD
ncbi:MAG: fibronectin type III domain-containing protein, partial [Opitutae bacterium]|nr:fibronectin type III domain-containing protein [Opitutae bacterium]